MLIIELWHREATDPLTWRSSKTLPVVQLVLFESQVVVDGLQSFLGFHLFQDSQLAHFSSRADPVLEFREHGASSAIKVCEPLGALLSILFFLTLAYRWNDHNV